MIHKKITLVDWSSIPENHKNTILNLTHEYISGQPKLVMYDINFHKGEKYEELDNWLMVNGIDKTEEIGFYVMGENPTLIPDER